MDPRSIPVRRNRWIGFGFALAALALVACSSSKKTSHQLVIVGLSGDVTAGETFAFQVHVVNDQGTLVADATPTISIAIGANPGGGTLSGTRMRQAVAGVATFDDLSIDKAGAGYTLEATGGGHKRGTSAPFAVLSGAAARLAFLTQPQSTGAFTPLSPALQVQVFDAFDNLVTSSVEVTLELGANPGELILHASGFDDAEPGSEGRMLELVDPSIPATLHWLQQGSKTEEVIGLVFDAAGDRIFAVTRSDDDFFTVDPLSGEFTLVSAGTVDWVRGLAFEGGPMPRLLALMSPNSSNDPDELHQIDPETGVMDFIGTLVPDMGTINGFTALARDPTDGTFYASANLGGLGLTGRALMQIDPVGLTATFLGDMEDLVSGLAAGADGTLYAVTGDGASVPETLHTVDKATGALTLLLPLGAGDDGETIEMVPARLRGATTVSSAGGIATFANVSVDAVASGYTLRASVAGLASATSGSFDVAAATPGGTVQFDAADQTVSTSDGSVTITVEIDEAQPHDVYVTMTVGGTAADANSGTPQHSHDNLEYLQIVIPAGESSASATIDIFGVIAGGPPPTIELVIDDASLAAAVGAIDAHVVTIQL